MRYWKCQMCNRFTIPEESIFCSHAGDYDRDVFLWWDITDNMRRKQSDSILEMLGSSSILTKPTTNYQSLS